MNNVMSKETLLYQLIWMSRPLMQNAEALVEAQLEGSGLTVRMRAVLEMLADHGAATVPEIAEHLQIQRQYVQVMVNDCHAVDLVQKQPNARHKRSMLIALTQKGEGLIRRVMAQEQMVLASFADEFDADALESALRVTKMLTNRIQSYMKGS